MMIPVVALGVSLFMFIVTILWLFIAHSAFNDELVKRQSFQQLFYHEQDRVRELEAAIKKHMGAKGHDRCWLNDMELYRVIDPEFDKMRLALPCLPEFIHNCSVYWRDSQPPEARKLGG